MCYRNIKAPKHCTIASSQMKALVLCLLAFGFCVNADVDCPLTYTNDSNGNCFNWVRDSGSYSYGHRQCAFQGAFMYDIKNAFDNSNVQTIGRGGANSNNRWLRLGLTCLTNSLDSCIWDSGRAIVSGGYNNFPGRVPNITAGTCVNMDLTTGMWRSANCFVNTYFGCQYTPGVSVQSCADANAQYFRGQCYFNIQSESIDDARKRCQAGCGDLPAIHSDGANNFINSFAINQKDETYSLLGLKTHCNATNCINTWMNGEIYDYSNFGYLDTNLGSCVSMAIKDDIVKNSFWINSPCITTELYSFVCSKGPNTTCNTLTCSSPVTVTGSGDLFSPGYPESSLATTCEYLISESIGTVATIQFLDISLNSYTTISLYDNLLDKPFAVLSATTCNNTVLYSPTNTLKVVYKVTNNMMNNYFHAVYSAAQPVTTTPPPPGAQPLTCLFIADWLYDGDITTKSQNDYLNELNVIIAAAQELFHDKSITFQAQLGVFGYVSASRAISSSLTNSWATFLANAENLQFYSGRPEISICETVTEVNNLKFPSGTQNTCLVFFSGQPLPNCRWFAGDNFKAMITATIAPRGVPFITTQNVPISANFTQTDVDNLVSAIKQYTLG